MLLVQNWGNEEIELTSLKTKEFDDEEYTYEMHARTEDGNETEDPMEVTENEKVIT